MSAREEPPRLSVEAAATALASRTPPLILDVRGRAEASVATIAGAINAGIEPDGFRPDGKGDRVILVTSWPPAPAVIESWRQRLESFGYGVSVLDGGFAAWREAKLPLDEGAGRLIRPGSVPFTIPRGLCESNTPAQVFQ